MQFLLLLGELVRGVLLTVWELLRRLLVRMRLVRIRPDKKRPEPPILPPKG